MVEQSVVHNYLRSHFLDTIFVCPGSNVASARTNSTSAPISRRLVGESTALRHVKTFRRLEEKSLPAKIAARKLLEHLVLSPNPKVAISFALEVVRCRGKTVSSNQAQITICGTVERRHIASDFYEKVVKSGVVVVVYRMCGFWTRITKILIDKIMSLRILSGCAKTVIF